MKSQFPRLFKKKKRKSEICRSRNGKKKKNRKQSKDLFCNQRPLLSTLFGDRCNFFNLSPFSITKRRRPSTCFSLLIFHNFWLYTIFCIEESVQISNTHRVCTEYFCIHCDMASLSLSFSYSTQNILYLFLENAVILQSSRGLRQASAFQMSVTRPRTGTNHTIYIHVCAYRNLGEKYKQQAKFHNVY